MPASTEINYSRKTSFLVTATSMGSIAIDTDGIVDVVCRRLNHGVIEMGGTQSVDSPRKGSPQVFAYTTADTIATVNTEGYFNE